MGDVGQAPPGACTHFGHRDDTRSDLKLFLAANSLNPAYGGPAYSVSRLAEALSVAGIDVGLWASDQSVATSSLLAVDSAVRRLTGSATEALDRFGPPAILHDNGIWRAHHHRLAVLAAHRSIPRVVSTRGMLEPWAIGHKRLKKRIGWWSYQRRDLTRASCLHATADTEAHNLLRLDLGIQVRVIPNGVDIPAVRERIMSEKRTALFLGRIYPVKGLPMLVQAWTQVRPGGWVLKIAGPDEGGHRAEIEKAVSAAGLQDVVTFVGPVDGATKRSALNESELLILPSHSESFAMAVAEALAFGLPVLTTTATPWRMLSERGCGWSVAPTVDGLTQGLQQATSVDRSTLAAMGARGRTFVETDFAWEGVARQFVTLYGELADVHRGGARC